MIFKNFFLMRLVLIIGFIPFSGMGQSQSWDSTRRPDIYQPRVELFKAFKHSKKDIIMLGNSITFWGDWPELLQSAKIKNRGIPGDNTFGVLERLGEVINRLPAKVFILIGINDIAAGIPDSIIARNLKRIVQRIKSESPRTKIYFQTLLPTNSSFPRKAGQFNKEAHIANVNASIKNIAAEENISLIDLFSAFSDSKGQLIKELSWDGVHLTASGYYKWAEILKEYIF
jgi:lysophospholipase L1-like esterase